MKHVRARQTNVLPVIAEHLILDQDLSKDVYLERLGFTIRNEPRNIYIAVSLDDKDSLAGFAIAYAPPGFTYVFVEQCWVDAEKQGVYDTKMAELYLERIIAWTESLGRTSVRFDTARDPKGFIRKYDFKVLSTVMEFKLFQDEELTNGQVKRTEIGEHTDESTEVAEQSVDQLHQSGKHSGSTESTGAEQHDRSGVEPVRGTDSGSTDGAISAGTESDPGIQSGSVSAADELCTGTDTQRETTVSGEWAAAEQLSATGTDKSNDAPV